MKLNKWMLMKWAEFDISKSLFSVMVYLKGPLEATTTHLPIKFNDFFPGLLPSLDSCTNTPGFWI